MNKSLLLTAVAGATLLVGGCAVYPNYDPYYDYNAPVVQVAPPPPQYEYVGAPPVVGHIWIGGYWDWVGSRYHWVPGRWEAPRPGHAWTPYRWERDGDRWRRYGGRWEQDRHYRPPVAPPHYEPGYRPQPPVVAPVPAPHYDHRDGPPRYERRDPPPAAPYMPPVLRPAPANPPAGMERHDDRRNNGRDGGDRRSRDRDIGITPEWREGQRP